MHRLRETIVLEVGFASRQEDLSTALGVLLQIDVPCSVSAEIRDAPSKNPNKKSAPSDSPAELSMTQLPPPQDVEDVVRMAVQGCPSMINAMVAKTGEDVCRLVEHTRSLEQRNAVVERMLEQQGQEFRKCEETRSAELDRFEEDLRRFKALALQKRKATEELPEEGCRGQRRPGPSKQRLPIMLLHGQVPGPPAVEGEFPGVDEPRIG
eukprot:Skav224452  [mRNA]  locus=scaffold3438:15592:16701:+ [translate_table: standard]